MKRRPTQTTLLDYTSMQFKKSRSGPEIEVECYLEESGQTQVTKKHEPNFSHSSVKIQHLSNESSHTDNMPVSMPSENNDISANTLFQRNPVLKWKHIASENLDLKYAVLFSKQNSDVILRRLEKEVEYFSGELLKVRIFGKWHQIPRKQVSYGDLGLTYTFSGNCIPAIPWTPLIQELRVAAEQASGEDFNFVLVNRYKNGNDYIGEHRDNEVDLVQGATIASLSFGQPRDFIFRHKDARGPKATKQINPLKFELEHGSILLMNSPTNKFWYHSLPVRKNAKNVRVNLTFRKMVAKH